jgi:hypothetical protein
MVFGGFEAQKHVPDVGHDYTDVLETQSTKEIFPNMMSGIMPVLLGKGLPQSLR